jgi:hypothetical protein
MLRTENFLLICIHPVVWCGCRVCVFGVCVRVCVLCVCALCVRVLCVCVRARVQVRAREGGWGHFMHSTRACHE